MPPIRIDADTGEVISEFDPNQWEPADTPPQRIDVETGQPIENFDPSQWESVAPAGWGETIGRTALAGAYKLGAGAAGLGRAVQEGANSLREQYPWIDSLLNPPQLHAPDVGIDPNFFSNTSEMGNQLVDEQRRALAVPPDSAKAATFDIGSEVVPDAALLAAGAVTGVGAPLIAGTLGLRSAGRKYNELRDAGADVGPAIAGAGTAGSVDTAMNMLPVSKAISEGAPLVKRVVGTGATNALLGAAQAPVDLAITDIASPQDFTTQDYVNAARTGATIGGATGATFGAIGGVTEAIKGPEQARAPGIEAAIDEMGASMPEQMVLPAPEPKLGLPAPEGKLYGDSFTASTSELVTPEQVQAARMAAAKAQAIEDQNIARRIENLSNPQKPQEFPSGIEVVENRARSSAEVDSAILARKQAESARRADETIARAPNKSPRIDSTETRGSFEPPIEPKKLIGVQEEVKAKPIDTSGDVKSALRDRVFSERGHAQLLEDVATGVKNATDIVRTALKRDPEFKDIPSSERKLRGLRGVFGNFWDNPSEVAERAGPNGVAWFDAAVETPRIQMQNLHDFGKSLQPFVRLKDKSRVGALARELRRYAAKRIDNGLSVPKFSDEQLVAISAKSPEFGGVPLTGEEIAALRSLQTTMGGALDKMGEALKARAQNHPDVSKAEYEGLIDTYISSLKDANYVPFSRFGDFYVTAKDELGNTLERRHFERRGQAQRYRDQLKATGQFATVEAGEIPLQSRLFKEQGFNPSLDIASFSPSEFAAAAKGSNSGFLRHMLRAALTEGEDANIEMSVAEYLAGLSRFHAIQLQEPKVTASLRALELENKALSAQKLSEVWKNWKKPTAKGIATWNQLVHTWFLAATPTAAIANATQVPVRIIPGIFREVGVNKGAKISTRATYNTAKVLGELALGKKLSLDSDTARQLTRFLERGGAGNTVMSEFADIRRGLMRNPTLETALFGLFNFQEKANNIYGFLSGLDIARAKGMKGDAAFAFAEKFNGDVNILQNDFGRPTALASPLGKVVGQYKNYQVQLLKTFLKDFAGTLKGDRRAALALAMQGAAYAILGGTSAVLGGTALRALSSVGINVPTIIEENAGDLADWINYGPFSSILNISPAVSTQELVPDIYNDPRLAIANAVVGAGGQFILNQSIKAYDIANKWDNPRLAAETLAPRAVRNLSRLERWMSEGKMRDFRDQILIDRPPTTKEIIDLALGAPPMELTKEYQKKAARRAVLDANRGIENLNHRIARSIVRGDKEETQSLIAGALKTGQVPSASEIRDQVIAQSSKKGGEYVARKRVPKRIRSVYDEIGSIYGN